MIKTIEAVRCEYCKALLEKLGGRYIVINGIIYCNLDILGQKKVLIPHEELVFCSPGHLSCYLESFL